ncbi:HAMP domain-containing protein [Pseudoduganella eburnea]|uniref:histidine kinase n=1 Tax=Massilia eburnea TaxID=1776165 RepID=A0A6L6QCV1_9BURK|nr:ATP-binding protein [Massilia eburnea]MTW09637.1 HAMP domain-containing protein [Massilia eburnea]
MKSFFRGMTGRVFLVLMLGILASAALTQYLAVNERQRTLQRYRDYFALERAEQIISTAGVVLPDSRNQYLRVASMGAIKLEVLGQLSGVSPQLSEFAATLSNRLGKEYTLRSLLERPDACERPTPTYTAFPVFGAGTGIWRGTCESLAVTMPDGQHLKLSILPPRQPAPTGTNEYVTFVPFLLSIAVLAYLVARMTMGPLNKLADAAKNLGQDINHPPIKLGGATEIRTASAAFNAMQARIRQHIAQRTEMLAAITHDLQTPLTRMRLRLEKVQDAELQGKLLEDLSAMQQMVKEGLDLARSMDTTEAMQRVDLDALLDSVCSDAADAGQQVDLKGRAAMDMMGRPLDIRRCLVNLIDNAVKYGQRAHVSVERQAGSSTVRIRDEGPGIPPGQLAQVFEPFYRLETSRNRSSGGTGLGLTIARNIAEQHGASLSLANHPEGGLEATLVFPEFYAGK